MPDLSQTWSCAEPEPEGLKFASALQFKKQVHEKFIFPYKMFLFDM